MLKDSIRDPLGTNDIRREEILIVENRAGDMSLCGKMDHRINTRNEVAHNPRIPHVSIPEVKPIACMDAIRDVLHVACVGEGVKNNESVLWICIEEVFE
jgi:hypothetical protein